MTILKCKNFTCGLLIMELLCAACLLVSCAGTGSKKPAAIPYIETNALPTRLAVLPARFIITDKNTGKKALIKEDSKKEKFIGGLTRGVINNQLAGKGYEMLFLSKIDKKLGSSSWAKMSAADLCRKLGVNGLIYPEIISNSMVSAVAYDLFKIDARIRMVNKKGKELGRWSSSSSKRKISLPTSPVGIAATLVGAFLDESALKQMRLVIYDWGWKVSQFVPNCPQGKSLPEVMSVDSNIDKGVFAAGEQIKVEVNAEKNLTCSFDLGDFKKNLPMPSVGGGVYKGLYVVQIGDQAANQSLTIHLIRPNGVERIWAETGGTVTIDGVLPPSPNKIKAQAGKNGISLSWALPQNEDLKEFVVKRSDTAVGNFAVAARTKDVRYIDAAVSQGHTYYYRIQAVDQAGNHSAHSKTVQVTMPFYKEVKLSGSLSGVLVPGLYRLDKGGNISYGNVLDIRAGSRITLGSDASLVVKGTLKVKGSPQRPIIFVGQGWSGIQVTGRGRVELLDATLKGCVSCLENDGGYLLMRKVAVQGRQGGGLVVKNDGIFTLKGVEVSGCKRAIVVESGKGTIGKSTLSRNMVGLDVEGGDVALNNSNVYGNAQSNIRTRRKMVLEGNYLGATAVKDLKLEGDILVKSLLDAPYPHGRKVVLVEDKEITPEKIAERFAAHKAKGIKAFRARRFGDAYQELVMASKLKEDKEIYLYLAYTLSSLGEDKKMAETLEQGIAAFPYEVRLYQVYVKYLVAHGKKQKALAVLKKAMRMNPEDQSLIFMKQYAETMSK